MRALLLHPEDSPGLGPWSREKWDLIVDLGKSSTFSRDAWSRQHGCPVLSADFLRDGVADARKVRAIFGEGRGRLVDEKGIDWWDLTSLLVAQEAMAVLSYERLAADVNPSAELWATRSGGPARLLAILLNRELHTFDEKSLARSAAVAMRYAGLVRRFSVAQIKEILLDKYDSGYQWRSRIASRPRSCAEQVVLVPSAYGNVSRMAGAYARLLPHQGFLMVTTRQSGRQFEPPPNVQLRDLAAFAKTGLPTAEIASLLGRWKKLETELCAMPLFHALSRAGALSPIAGWIRDGLSVRDAWQEVLEREPICGILCGDDSNRYTLLPVLLAARRKIPTVDFHHGAFDGRYLLKTLRCDVYLAKNEMERDYLLRVCGLPAEKVVIGAPSTAHVGLANGRKGVQKPSAIFFSEPYEVAGMRTEEVYRELLPPLCRLARENGRGVIIKLHPFEGRSQRLGIVRDLLTAEDSRLVTVVDGPLTSELMAQAWFGITVESTSVMDCLQNGIQCFLCGWLTLSPYGYADQYARFGVGEVLTKVEQVETIPGRLVGFADRPATRGTISEPVDPVVLQSWLTSGLRESVSTRPLS